jgi:phage replication O-like protein O
MANPQPDQYTKISNEILDALTRFRIPGESMQIIFVIIRLTWGYKKKADNISLSQFVDRTGLKRPNVIRAIQWLVDHQVIMKDTKSYVNEFSINKDYDMWIQLKKHPKSGSESDTTKVVVKAIPVSKESGSESDTLTGSESDTLTGSESDTHKRKKEINKRSKPKNSQKKYSELAKKYPLAELVYNLFYLNVFSTNGSPSPKTESRKIKALDAIIKCNRIDKYPYWKIADIILHFTQDEFWHDKLLSPLKLRRSNNDGITYIDYFDVKMKGEKIELFPPDDEIKYLNQLINESKG